METLKTDIPGGEGEGEDDEFGKVEIVRMDGGRPYLIAYNEGGYCSVHIDLLAVLDWAAKNAELVERWRKACEVA